MNKMSKNLNNAYSLNSILRIQKGRVIPVFEDNFTFQISENEQNAERKMK